MFFNTPNKHIKLLDKLDRIGYGDVGFYLRLLRKNKRLSIYLSKYFQNKLTTKQNVIYEHPPASQRIKIMHFDIENFNHALSDFKYVNPLTYDYFQNKPTLNSKGKNPMTFKTNSPEAITELFSHFTDLFAASSIGYVVGKVRGAKGFDTHQKVESYTFSETDENAVEKFINEYAPNQFLEMVTNSVNLNTSTAYVMFEEAVWYVHGQTSDTVEQVTVPKLAVCFVNSTKNAKIETTGDKQACLDFHKAFKKAFPNNTFTVTMVDSISDGRVNSRTEKIELSNINTQTKEFYPWLERDFDDLCQDFFKSNKAVLLLIGPPGMGKTTMCRNILKNYNKPAMLANNEQLFQTSALFEHFAGSDDQLLLIEDADNAVGPRSEGNAGMSFLLNLTDGIIPLKKKFVIVTNLTTIKKVDTALIRPGRCFDILEFRELTALEAQDARKSIGMPDIDLAAVKKNWTLAEALNYDVELNIKKRKAKAIGFTG